MLKINILFVYLILALMVSVPAQSPLGKVKDIVTNKNETNTQKNVEKPSNKVTENTNNSTAGTGRLLQNLLMERFVFNFDSGNFMLEQARAMNISSSTAKNVEVTMKVKNSSGKEFGSFSAFAQPPQRNISWFMSSFMAKPGTSPVLKLTEPGDHFLEFSAEGKVFDKFPFSIATMSGRNGATWYLVNGLWNDHAIIDTEVEFKFSLWMRDMLVEAGTREYGYGKFSAQIIREKDKKVLGVTDDKAGSTIAPPRRWSRYNITFVKDRNMRNKLEIADVTAQDGNYHIEFIHDGKLYGKYPFSVKGGKLQGLSEFNGTQLETSEGIITWLKRN